MVDLLPHEFSAFADGIADVANKREKHPNDFKRFQVRQCSLRKPGLTQLPAAVSFEEYQCLSSQSCTRTALLYWPSELMHQDCRPGWTTTGLSMP